MFLDRDDTLSNEFVVIEIENGTTALTVTPAHLLQVRKPQYAEAKYTFAAQLEENDYVFVYVNSSLVPRRVTKITVQLNTGVYAPLTRTGTIIVNSILASCYALVDSQSIAHWSFMPMRAISSVNEWFSSSNRLPSISRQSGIHWYAKALYSIKDYILPSDWIYQT